MLKLAASKITPYFLIVLLALLLITKSEATPLTSKASSKKQSTIARLLAKRNVLSNLPYASSAVVTSYFSTSRISSQNFSGNPPMLRDIPGQPIDLLFWRPGVVQSIIDGSPNRMQCGEFFAGQDEGFSGGMGACRMASDVGYTFVDLVHSQASLCYLRNIPSVKNFSAGGIKLTRGKLPNGGLAKLFNSPPSDDRIVKVLTGGASASAKQSPAGKEIGDNPESIFIQVSSEDKNAKTKSLYNVTIWHCDPDKQVKQVNKINISSKDMILRTENIGRPERGGLFSSVVTGSVKKSGTALIYDPSKTRTIDNINSDDGRNFKSSVEIGKQIRSKTYDIFENRSFKNYSLSNFRASDATDVQFIEGAYKGGFSDMHGNQTFFGATEYRDSYYASAPNNSLVSQLGEVDLDTDAFYSTVENVVFNTTQYNCKAKADVEFELDFSNETLAEIRADCENADFDNMHFCEEDPLIKMANENFSNACL